MSGLGTQRGSVRASCVFLAAIKAIAVEAILIISNDINIIIVPVKEIVSIGTNATAIAETNNLLKVLVLLMLPGIGNRFGRGLVISGLSGCTAYILKRVRNLLNLGCILPRLKLATILGAIVTNSGHYEPLKLIMPPLVVVRDECSHDCWSRTEAQDMRIHCKIDNLKRKGIFIAYPVWIPTVCS